MSQPTTVPTEVEVRTTTVDVPGAVLTYDVRPGAGTESPLLLIGSPMGAAGFGTLAGQFGDRTVITYDPRGVERSTKDEPTAPSTPEEHADDLHRLIAAVTDGPVDVFASSGGAVNALALVTAHPEQVRTLVAHEPPLTRLVPDAEHAVAVCEEIDRVYRSDGMGPAMAKFIEVVSHQGPIDAELVTSRPDPTMFGLPTEDDGARDDVLLGQNLLSCTGYRADLAALRVVPTRVVIGAGRDSAAELAHRAGIALAERIGAEVAVFPSGHAGFLGGEYGQTGEPEAFAVTLRALLADD